ncbi:FAD-binding oxidoreductase [Chachezhania antarctica]|uniref:FAD-binding oxidoreductase n=1 Tax=Chachezhania antarctica TaxID=2340860 RepID=UPI000EAD5C7B|nr:FAD-linked oxidase C-terminal domain-containing protein [Chachezhania antarctica]|tara:strand:+ start:4296 stop:5699 length:1404 start_codon:yes stop_codon:yes gene_type:complete
MVQAHALPRNEEGIAAATGILKQRFGDRFQTGASIREQHAHTTTYIANQAPDGVAYPETTEEVSEIVKICAAHKVPVIGFGTGSSLEGHVNAPAGGISVDFLKMDKVLAVHDADLDVVVQPGITREGLNTHLRDKGLFFPIDPGANASIGGMASTRASGTNAVRYGTMKDNILALEAVMPSGEIIRTATRARKSSAGYDLTRLLIGAEGTLGLITEITLKLHGIPEAISSARCSFPTVDAACEAVIATIQYGIPVARIELLDALSVKAANAYSGLGLPEAPLLLLEFHGSEAGVAEQTDAFRDIAEEFGGSDYAATASPEERTKVWKARHDMYYASLQLRPGCKGLSTDVCVPISNLADCVNQTAAKAAEMGLMAPIVGHVGDGNFHTLVLMDMENPEEIAKADTFVGWLNDLALSMDGTCTGEHGIGQGKRPFLVKELGGAVGVMGAIKRALDPDGIMNPGKIVPD